MKFFEIWMRTADRFASDTRQAIRDNVKMRGTAIVGSMLVFLVGAGGIMMARGFDSSMVASVLSIISILGLMSIVILVLLPGKQGR